MGNWGGLRKVESNEREGRRSRCSGNSMTNKEDGRWPEMLLNMVYIV
jgi:hypothetical protein